MTPIEMYRSMFFTYIGKFGEFVGVNVLDPHFRVSKITLFWMVINAEFIFASLYTFCTRDWESKQKATTSFGMGFQVSYLT